MALLHEVKKKQKQRFTFYFKASAIFSFHSIVLFLHLQFQHAHLHITSREIKYWYYLGMGCHHSTQNRAYFLKKRFSGDITVLHFSFTVTALICFGFSHTDLEACQKPTGNYQSLGKNVHSLTGWQVLAVAWLKWSQGSMRDVRTGFVIKSKLNTHWSKIKLND